MVIDGRTLKPPEMIIVSNSVREAPRNRTAEHAVILEVILSVWGIIQKRFDKRRSESM